MNAGRILREAGYDTEGLRVQIAPVNPDRVNLLPASRFFRRFWRAGISAVTHGPFVFIAPEVMNGSRDRLARLVIHELVHVRQYRAAGYLRFVTTYLKDYWMGRMGGKSPRQAYLDIAQEREARDVTEHLLRLM